MSYLVLARKWRPQTFSEIRGQEHIVRALTNAISSGRIAHAYVFSGIRGVGKTSAARILAKALNCSQGPTATPCNGCDSCREITEGRSPDVFEIDGASNTGVDDVRRLREAVRYPPVRGPYRVYIIDEVHMLSTAAFNALLKTLEEPPAHVVFVFATTDPHKIPVTILSRCQQFDFKRLAPRELTALLGEVARAEGIVIDEKSLVALAREADGSVRDAQSLLDQVISYAGQTVAYEDTRDVLGVVDRDLLLGVARCVVSRDSRGVLEALSEAERFGFDVRRFAYDLTDVFRDLAVLSALDEGEPLVELAPEEVAEARDFLEGASWEEIHARFDMLSRGLETLRSAPRPGTVLEMTLLKMARLPPILSLSEALVLAGRDGPADSGPSGATGGRSREGAAPPPEARAAWRRAVGVPSEVEKPVPPPKERPAPTSGSASETRKRAGPGPPPGKVAPPPPGSADGDTQSAGRPDAGNLWRAVLAGTERAHKSVWNVLKAHAKLTRWDPGTGTAEITYDDPGHGFFLQSKLDVLLEVLRGAAGSGATIELRCSGGETAPAGPKETDRMRQSRREALDHPLVREAVEIFDGDIEEVRVLKP